MWVSEFTPLDLAYLPDLASADRRIFGCLELASGLIAIKSRGQAIG